MPRKQLNRKRTVNVRADDNDCYKHIPSFDPKAGTEWMEYASWCRIFVENLHTDEKFNQSHLHAFCLDLEADLPAQAPSNADLRRLLLWAKRIPGLNELIGMALRQLYLFAHKPERCRLADLIKASMLGASLTPAGTQLVLGVIVLGNEGVHGDLGIGSVRFLCQATGLQPRQLKKKILRLKSAELDKHQCSVVNERDRERIYLVMATLDLAVKGQSSQELRDEINRNASNLAKDRSQLLHFLKTKQTDSGWWETGWRHALAAFKLNQRDLFSIAEQLRKDAQLSGDDRRALKNLTAGGRLTKATLVDSLTFRAQIGSLVQTASERSQGIQGDSLYLSLRATYAARFQRDALALLEAQAAPLTDAESQLQTFLKVKRDHGDAGHRLLWERGRATRWVAALARGTFAQMGGKAAFLGLVAGVAMLDESTAAIAATALCCVDVLLRLASNTYLYATESSTADTRTLNQRPMTLTLTHAAQLASLALVPITYSALCLMPQPYDPSNPEASEVYAEKLAQYHNMFVYATVLVASGTLSRVVRQVLQSATQSNLTRTYRISYLDDSPLIDSDQEYINFIRDLLYGVSTVTLLGGGIYSGLNAWSVGGLSAVNEGLDEIWPDLACVVATICRGVRWSAYRESNARFKLTKTYSSSFLPGSIDQGTVHIATQAAARIGHNGLADIFLIAGDIADAGGQKTLRHIFKAIGTVLAFLYGARRGAILSYQRGSSNVPTGLLGFIARKFGRWEAVGRIRQKRPAAEHEVTALHHDDTLHQYGDKDKLSDWRQCWLFEFNDGQSMVTFPSAPEVFHICDHLYPTTAAFNMLLLTANPDLERIMGRPTDNTDPDLSTLSAQLSALRKESIALQRMSNQTVCFKMDWKHRDLRMPEGSPPVDSDPSYACVQFPWKVDEDTDFDTLFIVCGEEHSVFYSSLAFDPILIVRADNWRDAAKAFFQHIKLPRTDQVTVVCISREDPKDEDVNQVIIQMDQLGEVAEAKSLQIAAKPQARKTHELLILPGKSDSTALQAQKADTRLDLGDTLTQVKGDKRQDKIYFENQEEGACTVAVLNMLLHYHGHFDALIAPDAKQARQDWATAIRLYPIAIQAFLKEAIHAPGVSSFKFKQKHKAIGAIGTFKNDKGKERVHAVLFVQARDDARTIYLLDPRVRGKSQVYQCSIQQALEQHMAAFRMNQVDLVYLEERAASKAKE